MWPRQWPVQNETSFFSVRRCECVHICNIRRVCNVLRLCISDFDIKDNKTVEDDSLPRDQLEIFSAIRKLFHILNFVLHFEYKQLVLSKHTRARSHIFTNTPNLPKLWFHFGASRARIRLPAHRLNGSKSRTNTRSGVWDSTANWELNNLQWKYQQKKHK